MNRQSADKREIVKNLPPTDLLAKLSASRADGCLQVSHNSISYFIYLAQGKLIYATNSLEPFERLERHLRRLSHEVTTLTSAIRTQTRLLFEPDWQNNSYSNSDYHAICWLVEQRYINRAEAAKLIKRITNEVFESYLLVPKIESEILLSKSDIFPIFSSLNWQAFINECSNQLRAWQALNPQVWSSYQRPYFLAESNAQRKISSRQQEQLGRILKGFSFRQLAALFNQDALQLAKKLYPLIVDGTILLRKPYSPFDRLPKISDYKSVSRTAVNVANNGQANITLPSMPNTLLAKKTWKIACVDDSPVILDRIERFLENDDFSVFLIQDPIKALIQILKIKPDLILLDIGMPNVDGYRLCSLLRNHSLFKMTPIVMVTGKEGFIDRAKAKLVGATDYITKPFTQVELLKIVFRYLT